jgi:predicted SAM-dependent methyltransferase
MHMIQQTLKDAYFSVNRVVSLPSTLSAKARYAVAKPNRPEGHYLHLGCGPEYIEGMINVDGYVMRKVDLWHDLRNGLPFPDKSCRFVYSCHTLEHLFPYEAQALLKEIRRVLADDGMVRVAVPGVEYAFEMIAKGRSPETFPRPFDDSMAQAINYLFCDGQHKYAYNFSILESFARQAGFGRVEHYSSRHGIEPKTYGAVTVGNEPPGSLVVELSA